MARYFHIQTPPPALIAITSEFVASVNDQCILHNIILSEGIGAGAEYLRELKSFPRNQSFANLSDIQQAAMIFAFDCLTQNPDRTAAGKPNCGILNNKLVAFDFEMCFSFVYPIIPLCHPYEVDRNIAKQHLFYQSLKGKVFSWEPFLNRLQQLSNDTIRDMVNAVPEEWRNDYQDAVVLHLQEARDHPVELHKNLMESIR